jgi:hypothetical protein
MQDPTGNLEYFLALRTTTETERYATGLRVSDLAQAVNRNAAKLRAIIILDCCYAGEAVRYFTGGDPVADPSSKIPFGLTLFTASSSRQEAVVPAAEKRTMFSGCVLDVLHSGIPERGPLLSIKDVADAARLLINQRYPDNGVRPEIHSPRQRYGDVADYGLFPNVASLSAPRPSGTDVSVEVPSVERGTPRERSLGFFVADAGLVNSSGMAVLACAVIEDPDSVRREVENTRRVLITSAVLGLGVEARERLRTVGFDYLIDDSDVRGKFIQSIATLTYEAYTCAANRAYFKETSEERIFCELFGRLLFDRISKHKSQRIEIFLRSERAGLVDVLQGVVSSCVHSINSGGRGKVLYHPTIHTMQPRDGCIEVVKYVAAIVRQRLDDGESERSGRRDFRRIESRVRLIRRLDTGEFFSRHRSLPD